MAAYTYLSQQPEIPISERWAWASDIIMSDNGKEQRISLSPVPARSWGGVFAFDQESDIRRHVAMMFTGFKGAFGWPAWHETVKLKAGASVGAETLFCNTSRTDFRAGAKAFIREGATFEVVTIDAISADNVTLADPTVNAYSPRALICPMYQVYSAEGAGFVRRPVNSVATSSFTFSEYSASYPFVLDPVELDLFDGLPVLNRRAIGTDFNHTVVTGIEETRYLTGQPDLRARWANSQFTSSFTFLSHRTFNPADWTWWKSFADYCLGSVKPFLMPSWREDVAIYTEAVAAGTTVDLVGTEYGDAFWPVESFRRIMFIREDGTQHFAKVTNRTIVGGRDRLTFAPALPAGDWSGQIISLLLQYRIADDTVAIEHQGGQSLLTLNLRTTDG